MTESNIQSIINSMTEQGQTLEDALVILSKGINLTPEELEQKIESLKTEALYKYEKLKTDIDILIT